MLIFQTIIPPSTKEAVNKPKGQRELAYKNAVSKIFRFITIASDILLISSLNLKSIDSILILVLQVNKRLDLFRFGA